MCCAATSTIREALEESRIRLVFWKHTADADLNTDEGCQQAAEAVTTYLEMIGVPAALASLEQFVEAAQAAVERAERLQLIGFAPLAAAVAAVGPGDTQPPKTKEALGEEAFQADVGVIRDVLNAADDPNRRRALAALGRLADNMAAVVRAEAVRAAVGPGEETAQ